MKNKLQEFIVDKQLSARKEIESLKNSIALTVDKNINPKDIESAKQDIEINEYFIALLESFKAEVFYKLEEIQGKKQGNLK